MPPTRGLTRRQALAVAVGVAGGLLVGCAPGPDPEDPAAAATPQPTPSGDESPMPSTAAAGVIVVYFSRAGENYWNGGRRDLDVGNTKVLAEQLLDRLGCDSYEIVAADAYPDDYDDTVARNVSEENADARPAIAGRLPDLSRYDTVLLGSPIWNVQPLMIMHTFVEAVDWTGKTLHPFVTYAVSGLGSTLSAYDAPARGATLGQNGLAVRGDEVRDDTRPAMT